MLSLSFRIGPSPSRLFMCAASNESKIALKRRTENGPSRTGYENARRIRDSVTSPILA